MSEIDGQEGENDVLLEARIDLQDTIVGSAHSNELGRNFAYYIQRDNVTSDSWNQMLTNPELYLNRRIRGSFVDINGERYVIWNEKGGEHTAMITNALEKHLPQWTDDTQFLSFDVQSDDDQTPRLKITPHTKNDALTNKFAEYLGRNISPSIPVSVTESRYVDHDISTGKPSIATRPINIRS